MKLNKKYPDWYTGKDSFDELADMSDEDITALFNEPSLKEITKPSTSNTKEDLKTILKNWAHNLKHNSTLAEGFEKLYWEK